MRLFLVTTWVLSWAVQGFALPGFVKTLQPRHPELRVNCTTCHRTQPGEPFLSANVTEKGLGFYQEILQAQSKGPCCPQASPFDTTGGFVVFGDSRTQHDVHRQLTDKMCKEGANLIIHTGDLVEDGAMADQWERIVQIDSCLLKKKKLRFACGNHDGAQCVTNPFAKAAGVTQRYYTFELGTLTFLFLDSNHPSDPKQLEWLSRLPTGKKYIPVYHHAPYPTMAAHTSEEGVIKHFVPQFKRLGVKLSINGHNHGYDRALVDGIQYVTTGGGGAPLYPCGHDKPFTQVCYSVHHYLKCSFRGNKILCIAVRNDGALLDTFGIDYAERPVK